MEVKERVEISDFRHYYSLLRQGRYLLSMEDCDVIGDPVTEEEEPMGFFPEKDIYLYDRSGKFTMVFNSGNESVDNKHLMLSKDLEKLNVDVSNLSTEFYFMYGGKLQPVYHTEVLMESLGMKIYKEFRDIPMYLWRENSLISAGAKSVEDEPVAIEFDNILDRFNFLYDCRPVLKQLGLSFMDEEELESIHSFHCLTDSEFYLFPKAWGVKSSDWEDIGYIASIRKVYKFKNDETVKDSPLSNILNPSDIDDEDLILHIRELDGFKSILNFGKKKITSIMLKGILEDGRAVFKPSEKLKENHPYDEILKIFQAKYKL